MQKSLLSFSGIFILAMMVLLINGISDRLFSRFYVDLTDEGLYSLSDGSKNIVHAVTEPITLKFYFSKTDGSKFPAVKLYGTRILDLLREYQREGKGKIQLETYDPRPDSEEEEWAQKFGLSPLSLPNGGTLFFGLVALSAGKEEVIPLFDFTRQEFLEYDVSKLIYSLNAVTKPVVAVITPLDIRGDKNPQQQQFPGMKPPSDPWIVLSQLEKFAEVRMLGTDVASIPDNVKILMVIHPKNLPEQTRYAIDQYVVKGGNAFIAVDPFCASDQPAQDPQNPLAGLAADRSSGLPELFKAWGIEMVEKKVIGDLKLATKVASGPGGASQLFPVWITLGGQAAKDDPTVSKDDVATAQLDNIMLAWPGGFTLANVDGITAQPLFHTSKEAMAYEENDIRFSAENPDALLKKFQPGNKSYVLAAKLSGKFKSSFKGKPGAENAENKQDMSTAEGHVNEGVKPGTVVVVADVDFMADQFSASSQNLLGTRLVSLLNDNLVFVANAVENLAGSNELISLRSRGKFSRPFTKVQEIESNAQQRWREEETLLEAKLNTANQRLSELQASADTKAGANVFTSALLDEIKKFRDQRAEAQRRLREVRRELREDKEKLGTVLFALNTFAIPVLLVIGSLVLYQRKVQRTRARRSVA